MLRNLLLSLAVLSLSAAPALGAGGGYYFSDDFEQGLGKWEGNAPSYIGCDDDCYLGFYGAWGYESLVADTNPIQAGLGMTASAKFRLPPIGEGERQTFRVTFDNGAYAEAVIRMPSYDDHYTEMYLRVYTPETETVSVMNTPRLPAGEWMNLTLVYSPAGSDTEPFMLMSVAHDDDPTWRWGAHFEIPLTATVASLSFHLHQTDNYGGIHWDDILVVTT